MLIWIKHYPLQFGFVSYRGPGALRSGGAFGERLNRGGSDAEQVCVSHIYTHLPAAKLHVTDSKIRESQQHKPTFDMKGYHLSGIMLLIPFILGQILSQSIQK